MMIMIGDTFHNFVDGALIAAAFLANHELGIVTAIAIIATKSPGSRGFDPAAFRMQQAGLAHQRAVSLAMLAGSVLAYSRCSLCRASTDLAGIGCASMIYVAVADLILA
jgi:zinc and cadmium transporter